MEKITSQSQTPETKAIQIVTAIYYSYTPITKAVAKFLANYQIDEMMYFAAPHYKEFLSQVKEKINLI